MQRDIIGDVRWQAVLFPERPGGYKVERGHVSGHPDGAGFTPFLVCLPFLTAV